MRYMLVVSKEQDVFSTIHSCFRSEYRVQNVADEDAALEMLHKERYDFIFIDVEILRELSPDKGYKAALQPFWDLYPTVEIIVMSSQELIREAVKAVKAGASDYLTYPLNPDETKYVVEIIYEALIAQSEIDYLRDQFWETDLSEIIQTKNPISLFRQVFAASCEPRLGDGPPRRYLYDPCIGAWVLTPPLLNGALVRFFPFSIGLPLGERGLAHGKLSH